MPEQRCAQCDEPVRFAAGLPEGEQPTTLWVGRDTPVVLHHKCVAAWQRR